MKKILILQDTELPGLFFAAGYEGMVEENMASLLVERGHASYIEMSPPKTKKSSKTPEKAT